MEEYISDCTFYIYPYTIPQDKISEMISRFGIDNFGYINGSKILFLKTSIYHGRLVDRGAEFPELRDFNYIILKCNGIKLETVRSFVSQDCLNDRGYLKDNYLLWEWFKNVSEQPEDEIIRSEYLKIHLDPIIKSLRKKISKHLEEARKLTRDLGDLANG